MAAKRTKITDDELYRRYSRDYNKISNRLYRNLKRRMFTEKMTKDDFLTFYKARKNDMEEYADNMGSEKPRSQSVIDSIISDQKYKLSIRQARVIRQSLEADHTGWDDHWPKKIQFIPGTNGKVKETRVALTEENIRQGWFDAWARDIWDRVRWWRKQRREELERQGKSKKEIDGILEDEVVEVFDFSP